MVSGREVTDSIPNSSSLALFFTVLKIWQWLTPRAVHTRSMQENISKVKTSVASRPL